MGPDIKSKGQFFIIAAIIIVLSLIIIRGLLGIYSTAETNENEKSKIENMKLSNLKGEYEYIIGISSVKADPNYSMNLYLSNFSEYVRGNEKSKILWISIFVNGSNQKYYVVAGNYLQNGISINMTPTNTTPSFANLNLSDMATGSYTFSSLINGTVNFTITYSFEGSIIQDTFLFSVSNTSSTAGFFDISLFNEGLKVRTKHLYQRMIS